MQELLELIEPALQVPDGHTQASRRDHHGFGCGAETGTPTYLVSRKAFGQREVTIDARSSRNDLVEKEQGVGIAGLRCHTFVFSLGGSGEVVLSECEVTVGMESPRSRLPVGPVGRLRRGNEIVELQS